MTSIGQRTRTKRIALIGVLSVLIVAVACFVLGYGLSEGWQAVAAWFTSKWATLALVGGIVVIGLLLVGIFFVKDKEDFK